MNVLIVFAHPEPDSFAGAMKNIAVDTLTAEGHTVVVSDLYTEGFQASAGPADVTKRLDSERFDLGAEQAYAAKNDCFAGEIQGEIDRLFEADMLILQFPMWWFSVPAIMKGWIDRVFAFGVTYEFGQTWDKGILKGRRAMLSFTTSAPEGVFATDGRSGDLERLLWPIHGGVLALCGYEVLSPYVGYAVPWIDDAGRQAILDNYRQRLIGIEKDTPLFFHRLEDFGDDHRMKPDVEPATPAQHRGPRKHLS
jgi:NAD(P)H dehydrogenase (quinone)